MSYLLSREITYYAKCNLKSDHVIAGIDEVGRGSLAGPVSVALVAFHFGSLATFAKTDLRYVNDSKQLSETQRTNLAKHIKSTALLNVCQHVSAKIIDRTNINIATDRGIKQCLKIAKKRGIQLHSCLIDGNSSKVAEHFSNIRILSQVKGDANFFSIACASIIAKDTRDQYLCYLHRKYPNYNFIKNKGYPTVKHKQAIQQYGICAIHRLTYRSCQKY